MPYQIHTILTDNGIQFAEQPRNWNTIIRPHGLIESRLKTPPVGRRFCIQSPNSVLPSINPYVNTVFT
ncbi:hypothetical protein D7027_22355 [Ochrobactrum intermedium]|nr:hypothetical protein [Brucella intermedia]